ncbi:DUF4252 domain-containing protein [Prevotella dentasini]|uniref:DUF4252 domain-containing protein n=1 Tax=Prevotella dentasini TaxID=589537 RepID=UPI000468DE63|nr:DUF4252 domain-containing protein [Prevotella dentasini]
MKRTTISLLLTLVCIMAQAQQAVFNKYSDYDGVSVVYISKYMLRGMQGSKSSKDAISRIAGRLDHLQIFSCDRPSLIPRIKKDATAYYRKMHYGVAMQMSDDGEHTTIYQRAAGSGKNEFVLLTTEKDELTIINVLGSVSLKDIQGLTGD